jgi:hypothetical protein
MTAIDLREGLRDDDAGHAATAIVEDEPPNGDQTTVLDTNSDPDGPNSVNAGPPKNAERNVEHYAQLIREFQGQSVMAILNVASTVSDARHMLGYASFGALAKELEMPKSTLNKYTTIHSQRERFDGKESVLPPRMVVVYQLSRLKDDEFKALVAAGRLRPALTEKEVRGFIAGPSDDGEKSAPDQKASLSAKIVFPARFSKRQEEDIKRKVSAAIADEAEVTIDFSERKPVTARK